MYQFSYKNKDKETVSIEVSKEVYDYYREAVNKYETSRSYIDKYMYHIWNKSIKDYMMFTGDRATRIKSWQSNLAIGMVRQTIDTYQSFLIEKPLAFSVTGLNEQGAANRQAVSETIAFIGDATKFNDTLIDTMIEGLIMGNYCFKTIYLKTPKKTKGISIVNGAPYEVEYTYSLSDIPYSQGIDIYKVFPDPYQGKLRYITERDVVPLKEFLRLFQTLIKSKDNKSPFKTDDFLQSLPLNNQQTDLEDYGRVRNQVFEYINNKFKSQDSLVPLQYGNSRVQSHMSPDTDAEVTKDLIEYRLTVTDENWTLIANNIPVYVGKNPYGMINYEYGTAYHTLGRFSEGLAYLISGFEEIGTSFLNAYIDGAKAIIHPNMVANKNLVINPKQLENAGPGDIIYTDGDPNGVRRLEKGSISDFGMMNILSGLNQSVSGVSDYNAGVSARERVATAVATLVESTNRRIARYVKKFSMTVGNIGEQWLNLAQKYWTKEQWVYVIKDGEQVSKTIKNSDLFGAFNVTLNPETFLGVSKEMEIKRAIDVFNLLAPTGIINSSEWAKDIIKASGKDPMKFIVDQEVIIPANKQADPNSTPPITDLVGEEEPTQEDMGTELSQELGQAMSSQIDLGNSGNGQP